MSGILPSAPAAAVLLGVLAYLLVRVFILARPMHERTFKEVFEDMALELAGAALVVLAVFLYPVFL